MVFFPVISIFIGDNVVIEHADCFHSGMFSLVLICYPDGSLDRLVSCF